MISARRGVKAIGVGSVALVVALAPGGEPSAQPAAAQPAAADPPPAGPQPAPESPAAAATDSEKAAPTTPSAQDPQQDGDDDGPLGSPLAVPPPPGTDVGVTPPVPPPPPRAFADERGQASKDDDRVALAGWHGRFFVRDRDDNFRLYPGGHLSADLGTWFGSGVDTDARTAGGAGLSPRISMRRARLELAGELLARWSFLVQVDFGAPMLFGTQGLAVGERAPSTPTPLLGNAWINYELCDCFNVSFGQMRAPVSMENRTPIDGLTLAERSIATRSFVAPGERETGITIWGSLFDDLLSYEIMGAGGDGNQRAQVDGSFDAMGRIIVRPLQSIEALEDAHIGISARHGNRDQYGVGYDQASVVTGQDLVLWAPSYLDAQGRLLRIHPSGAQNQIGGELRVPVGPLDLRGELHYVANGTREAVDGFALAPTNAERFGLISGIGTYASITWWALGDEFITGPPGARPVRVNLKRKPELKRGLAVSGVVSAISASYEGSARQGTDDPRTPGSAGEPQSGLDVVQLALNASYFHTRHVRILVDYSAYLTGGAEPTGGLLRVPGNLGPSADASSSTVHELGSRVQVFF